MVQLSNLHLWSNRVAWCLFDGILVIRVTQEPLVSMEILDCLEQLVHLEIQEYLVQKETR